MLAQAGRSFEALQLQGAQERLNLGDEPTFGDTRGRLLAVGAGFSLHAGTSVHANDANGLSRLCRYGARGPTAESRLSRRDDGKYAYETKKGVTLLLTAQQLVRRLLWLIPPARFHLTSFHGVLWSHAAERATVMPATVCAAQSPARAPATGATAVKEEILRNLGLLPAPRRAPSRALRRRLSSSCSCSAHRFTRRPPRSSPPHLLAPLPPARCLPPPNLRPRSIKPRPHTAVRHRHHLLDASLWRFVLPHLRRGGKSGDTGQSD